MNENGKVNWPIYHNGALFAMMLMELQHVLKWEVTDNVTVENKERLLVV